MVLIPSSLKITLAERIGTFLGYFLGIGTAIVSFIRRARTFHPRGVVFRGKVATMPGTEVLEGEALIRFSGALWKNRDFPDVFGLALRIGTPGELGVEAHPRDQDILFATIRRPWLTPFGIMLTHQTGYLDNSYYGVSPFSGSVARGLFWLRIRPVLAKPARKAATRRAALHLDIQDGVQLILEKSADQENWEKILTIQVGEEWAMNQATLRFWPFRTGRGIVPRGFVHALRRGAYRFSQNARPIK